jgi:hypothetical protein
MDWADLLAVVADLSTRGDAHSSSEYGYGDLFARSFNCILLESSFIGVIAGFVSSLCWIFAFGPIPWLIIRDLSAFRRKAVTLRLLNWFFIFLTAQIFLCMIKTLGSEGTFFLFAVLSLLALFFVYQYVPETKGKSLEEIEQSMRRG